MLFRLFCLIISGVVIWRGIVPFRLPEWLKYLLSILVVGVMFNTTLQRLTGLENLPTAVLLTISLVHSLTVLYAALLVVFEAVYWSGRGYFYWKKNPFPAKLDRWFFRAGLLPVALIVTVWGMYNALKMPDVKEYEITLPALPPELDGLTIAQISDIHADQITDGRRVAAIAARVNALNPDIIAVTGDMVDRRADIISDDLRVLGTLRARYGVFGVPGNHEYYSGYAKWIEFFNSIGIKMLENRHELIAEKKIALGGVTDPAAEFMDMEVPDLGKTFAGSPDEAVRILLAHQPRVAKLAADHKVALQLSGHTHGGMLYGMDMLVALFNMGMISGEYEYRGMKVFISNGTGIWSGFPVRIGHGSEIVLLRLKRGKL